MNAQETEAVRADLTDELDLLLQKGLTVAEIVKIVADALSAFIWRHTEGD